MYKVIKAYRLLYGYFLWFWWRLQTIEINEIRIYKVDDLMTRLDIGLVNILVFDQAKSKMNSNILTFTATKN